MYIVSYYGGNGLATRRSHHMQRPQSLEWKQLRAAPKKKMSVGS